MYTDAGKTIRTEYPRSLVRCEHKDGENPDVWSPEKDCASGIPVCDSSGHAGNVLACLAYPAEQLQGKRSELQAAAFSVSRIDSLHSEQECLRMADASTAHAERIGGTRMEVANSVETETGHKAERSIYRVFHKSSCYELDITFSLALDAAFAVEDAPRKLTADERRKINDDLTVPLSKFRFLK